MNFDILRKNIKSLLKYNVYAAQYLNDLDFEEVKDVYSEKTESGHDTGVFYKNNQKYYLHSKENPQIEGKYIVENIDFNRDSLITVYGIGLAYHLFELKKQITKDTRVFIVEHNIDVLKYALLNIDMTELFETPQFLILFGEKKQMETLILSYMPLNFYNLVHNMQTVKLPNYHLYDKENLEVMKKITQGLSSVVVSKGNSLEDMFNGFRNNYLNIDAIMESNSIKEIKNKYEGYPAVIVASGPSLDKNIKYLKEAYGKSLIIACDASLRACNKWGVKPDAIASIERDQPTYDYYYKEKTFDEDLVLVGPGLLWPKIYEEYKGKKIIMAKNFEGAEGWWYDHFDNIDYVNQGQSSATVAFTVAQQAGCNPIILIGQDLAFTNQKKHSEFAHVEEEGANDDNEADGVFLEDYEGNLLPSDWIYKLFRDWYEQRIVLYPDTEIIDATQGGAYIHGSTVMDFKEAIDKYCVKDIDKKLYYHLEDTEVDSNLEMEKYKDIIKNTKKQIKSLNRIKRNSQKHFDMLNKLFNKYNLETCNEEELIEIVEKMQKGDKIIQQILDEENSVRAYFNQIIIQTIANVKRMGNELTNENVIQNLQLQLNLMYMMKESTNLVIDEYKELLEYIQGKKENYQSETKEIQ